MKESKREEEKDANLSIGIGKLGFQVLLSERRCVAGVQTEIVDIKFYFRRIRKSVKAKRRQGKFLLGSKPLNLSAYRKEQGPTTYKQRHERKLMGTFLAGVYEEWLFGPFRPVVMTSSFHVEDTGSIPVRDGYSFPTAFS
ncbi:hypothetical protein RYX36_018020 [Vicia faba]